MTTRVYKNFVEGTLASGIAAVDTPNMSVAFATNATVPVTADFDSKHIYFVIDPEGAEHAPEIVKGTAISGSGPYTIAITRSQNGTTPQVWDSGRKVVAALIEEDITNFATKDGTTFTGDVAVTADVTVGVDGTGHDVKFFGDSAGHYALWDQSADELVLASDSKLSFHDAAGGENIVASADGHLEVNAGTTLDLTAPTIDLNASTVVNIDGELKINAQSDILTLQDSGATGQSGYVAFKDSGGTQLGYIGYPSNDDIYIKNEDADGDIYIWAASGRTVKSIGNVVVGSDGSGHDVTFHSDTAGDSMVWDSSAEKLTITGTAGQDALHVAAGNINFDGNFDFTGTLSGTSSIPRMAYTHASSTKATVASHQLDSNPSILICDTQPTASLNDGDIWFDIS